MTLFEQAELLVYLIGTLQALAIILIIWVSQRETKIEELKKLTRLADTNTTARDS